MDIPFAELWGKHTFDLASGQTRQSVRTCMIIWPPGFIIYGCGDVRLS